MKVAALFVDGQGVYAGLPNVDPWPVERDARTYAGPHPVVAHPPCERWGSWAEVNPNPKARRRVVGDDGGCFEAALASVRRFGGVIEHPRGSRAWAASFVVLAAYDKVRDPKVLKGWAPRSFPSEGGVT